MTSPSPNPFSTRFTQPTAAPFLFADASQLERLRKSLLQHPCSAIVGPHGSGKSTLLSTLIDSLADQLTPHWFRLHADRPNRLDLSGQAEWSERDQIVVDGYEQLSWWGRRRLRRVVRRRGARLVVTSHDEPPGFEVIFRTRSQLQTARRVVARLLKDDWTIIRPEDVEAAFQRRGEIRETLFDLYDLYERRTRDRLAYPEDA